MGNIVGGLLRTFTPAIVAWLAAKGWFGGMEGASAAWAIAVDVIPIVVTGIAGILSIRSNLLKNQVAQIAARPEVKSIVLEPAEAVAARAASSVDTAHKVTVANGP